MAKKKKSAEVRTRESILKEWRKLEGKSCIGKISEEDKLAFERAKFSEKQAKKISFILGEPIKNSS